MDQFLSRIKAFDAYPKTLEDFRVKTKSGALLTLVTGLFIFFLFLSEFGSFLRVNVRTDMSVDTTRGEKLRINFNLTFPRTACGVVSVDVMDIIGEQQFDVEHTVLKRRIDPTGRVIPANEERETRLGGPDVPAMKNEKAKDPKYCGSCYGAEDETNKCCNTCDQIRDQYRKKGWAFAAADSMEQCVLEGFTEKIKAQVGEGCNVYGYIMVNKVAGNFHFAPGKSFQHSNMHVHDFMPFEMQGFNLSHTVHQLSFGEYYPGLQNPLDNVVKVEPDGPRQFQYFLKVVPTQYNYRNGKSVRTNQFSVTESERRIDASGGRGLPGVFFMYDLSPIQVTHTEYRTSFGHFLTSLCAIVGGTFTVAGIIDSCVYHGMRNLRRKVELGKHT